MEEVGGCSKMEEDTTLKVGEGFKGQHKKEGVSKLSGELFS